MAEVKPESPAPEEMLPVPVAAAADPVPTLPHTFEAPAVAISEATALPEVGSNATRVPKVATKKKAKSQPIVRWGLVSLIPGKTKSTHNDLKQAVDIERLPYALVAANGISKVKLVPEVKVKAQPREPRRVTIIGRSALCEQQGWVIPVQDKFAHEASQTTTSKPTNSLSAIQSAKTPSKVTSTWTVVQNSKGKGVSGKTSGMLRVASCLTSLTRLTLYSSLCR